MEGRNSSDESWHPSDGEEEEAEDLVLELELGDPDEEEEAREDEIGQDDEEDDEEEEEEGAEGEGPAPPKSKRSLRGGFDGMMIADTEHLGGTGASDDGASMEVDQDQPPAKDPERDTGQCSRWVRKEDICAVCYQAEWTDCNLIFYCDICEVPFHQVRHLCVPQGRFFALKTLRLYPWSGGQNCYNVPEVPTGHWRCDYCA
jgi:hypothetical protein